MCGIVGFLDTAPSADPRGALLAQLAALTHRGPDGQGHYLASRGLASVERESCLDGRTPTPAPWRGPLASPPAALEVGIGVRRLAIVGREGGLAPVLSEQGDVIAVLNGELYNYPILQERLRARGHRLASASDSEILPHLYEEFGFEGLLAQIRGQFAIALYDARRGILFLARDPLGIKPLYVAQQRHPGGGERIYFASELKGILAHPGVTRRLNPLALTRYLSQEGVPSPHGMLLGSEKVEPGTYLEFAQGPSGALTRRRRVFWRIPERGADRLPDLPALTDTEGWKARVWSGLETAVAERVPQEVPVAALLSGGIDSGLITTLLSRAIPGRLTAFSLTFEDSDFNEAPLAQETARHLGARHHLVPLAQAQLPAIVEAIGAHMDEPLGDHSLIPTWHLMQAVRGEGFPVALAGDGGDELFGGYPTYLARRLDGLWDRLPEGLTRGLLALLDRAPASHGNVGWDVKARLLLEGALSPDGPSRQARWMGAMTPSAALDLLSPDGRAWVAEAGGEDPLAEVRRWAFIHRRRGGLEQALVQDLRFYLQDVILVKEDRASMAHGVEVRVPMLDTALVALAMCLPAHLRVQRWQTKWILRELARTQLPALVAQGPKRGFAMPTGRWLRDLPEATLRDWLAPPAGEVDPLDPAKLDAYVRAHREGHADHRRVLWTVIMLRQWQRSPWAAPMG